MMPGHVRFLPSPNGGRYLKSNLLSVWLLLCQYSILDERTSPGYWHNFWDLVMIISFYFLVNV